MLAAVDGCGFRTDGRLLALNSYENRVVQLGLEAPLPGGGEFLVAKFYRPERWSDASRAVCCLGLALRPPTTSG